MRTRVYNKMTAREVEDYLARGGRTLFVALGVTEVHGARPIDCEGILSEAVSLALTEETDGLAVINLPFFPGGTIISNATVQVSVRESIDFLMILSRSLVNQGFDRIFFVTGHGPAGLHVDAMCRDFFQEKKIHLCHLNLMMAMGKYLPKGDFSRFDTMIFGAYKMMHQMDYLPVDPEGEMIEPVSISADSPLGQLQGALRKLGCRMSTYYEVPEQHFGGAPFESEEARLTACTEGELLIRQMAANIAQDVIDVQKALGSYHAYVQTILEKYPHTR